MPYLILLFTLISSAANAQSECRHMEAWDPTMNMCMPRAMPGMPMKMLMVHGNVFATQIIEEGKRGRNAFAVPNTFMIDYGQSVGDIHYVNLDLMGTLEKWTFPKDGYPLLGQIGEENEDGEPFLDAQHNHSSPIMGLTLSDTISIGEGQDYIKLFFAPRGQSTDGPIAFMHRPTGKVNPDAPLGHHIGQDAGHITSTVLGTALHKESLTLEASTFHGREPEPSEVDLPMGKLDSWATRFIWQSLPGLTFMVSYAYVSEPEGNDGPDHVNRFSVSTYASSQSKSGWLYQTALIAGTIDHYDNTSSLSSLAYELTAEKKKQTYWGRIERVERTAAQLQISTTEPDEPRAITAATVGYTHKIASRETTEIGIGASVTKDFMPNAFEPAYGGDPLSGKVFLQVSGTKMKEL